MSTRNNPGPRDCLAKAEPDEPYFVLLGRDRASPVSIRIWSHLWLEAISLGIRPESDRPQVIEALGIAYEMEKWLENRDTRLGIEAAKMDSNGYPTVGPHARKEHNTTSGATDV
jgi:hypothetical protein